MSSHTGKKGAFPSHGDNVGQKSKKNLLTLFDYSPEEIEHLILLAKNLKTRRPNRDPKVFENKTGVLIFEKPSLRTRITFDLPGLGPDPDGQAGKREGRREKP
jgi:hypothetical protein